MRQIRSLATRSKRYYSSGLPAAHPSAASCRAAHAFGCIRLLGESGRGRVASEAEAARSGVRWHVSRPCGTLHCFALPSTPASFLIISAIFARRMPAAPKLAWRSEGRHACAGCGRSRLCGGGCGRR